MKKFLLAAIFSAAFLVSGQAKAFTLFETAGQQFGHDLALGVASNAVFVAVAAGIAYVVYEDIKAGGLHRKYAELPAPTPYNLIAAHGLSDDAKRLVAQYEGTQRGAAIAAVQ